MITLRPDQEPAVDWLCQTKRGIIHAPAGSGKTVMVCAALSRVLDSHKRDRTPLIEVMVNSKEQREQFERTAALFPVIGQKAELSVFCAPSAPLGTDPDVLVVDECHHASARTWATKILEARNARWGLSATPFYGDERKNNLVAKLFNECVFEVDRNELVDLGHLAPAKVFWLPVPAGDVPNQIDVEFAVRLDAYRKRFPGRFRIKCQAEKEESRVLWPIVERLGLRDNEIRNTMIAKAANCRVQAGHSVLLLVREIEHAANLQKRINCSAAVFSKMKAKASREAIQGFKDGRIRCLVSTALLDEGFDAPRADCLIVGIGGRSSRKVVQSSGRVLRPFDGKDHGVIVDFADESHGMLAAQARKRRRIYDELGYGQIDVRNGIDVATKSQAVMLF